MDFRPCFISYGATAPEVGTSFANILWFDTANATLMRYTGTTWVALAGAVGGGGGGGPHTHPTSDIVGLDDALTAIDDTLADHDDAIAGKADAVHTHAQSDVTGLVGALAGKADSTHGHAQADITGLVSDLAGKAAVSHTHSTADVTGLDAALTGKQATTEKAQANGYASLGADGKVPSAQLPASGGSGTPVNYVSLLVGI